MGHLRQLLSMAFAGVLVLASAGASARENAHPAKAKSSPAHGVRRGQVRPKLHVAKGRNVQRRIARPMRAPVVKKPSRA